MAILFNKWINTRQNFDKKTVKLSFSDEIIGQYRARYGPIPDKIWTEKLFISLKKIKQFQPKNLPISD